MTIIDYILIGAAVIALVVGLIKGVLSMVIDLGGFLLGLYVAGQFSTAVSAWMVSLIESESTRNMVAYIVCVIVTIIVVAIIGKVIKSIIKKVRFLKVLDRLAGAVVSVGIVYAIFGLIFALLTFETDISLVNVIIEFIEGYVPADCFALTVYGETNVVGNWLMSLLFPGA